MQIEFPLFSDPLYSADGMARFDPRDVVVCEQKRAALFLRGQVWTTSVVLKDGTRHTLAGQVASQIEAARRQISE